MARTVGALYLPAVFWRMRHAWMVALLCLLTAAARAQGGGEDPAKPEASVKAFREGVRLYAAGQFDAALAAFRESHAAYESPNALLGVARCLRDLGRHADAALAYEDVISLSNAKLGTAPEYTSARDRAEAELAEVATRVARVRLTVAPEGAPVAVRVAGKPWERAQVARGLPVVPGVVVVEVQAEGFLPERREYEVAARAEVVDRITLRAVPVPAPVARGGAPGTPASGVMPAPASTGDNAPRAGTGALPVLGWVSLGLGAASLGASAVLLALGDSQHDELVRSCVRAVCSESERDSLASTGRTYEAGMVASLVAGVGLVGVGALLLWLGAGEREIAPTVAASETEVLAGVSGSF